ncbi:hypothetical protein OG453_25345 [Streptomyces sp. NBC_01381]|uniref:hypothetical protein n=1 Tax=Streptomyces sp. NBC_01381 TaxID=2903845 RepID=UPI002250B83D|nr:hypothetical protein [Streptomyces sp. NBC_01381]MCX4669974.1 hypothetical protein [Streptomyces sp. NBC_01381]
MPTVYGSYELSIADDLGLDTTPVCCGEETAAKDNELGYRDYTCGDCAGVVTVSPSGLVFDITD